MLRATRAVTVRLPTGVRHVSAKAAGVKAKVACVLGSQWGDEGKGKLADVLAKKCVRCRGSVAPLAAVHEDGLAGKCADDASFALRSLTSLTSLHAHHTCKDISRPYSPRTPPPPLLARSYDIVGRFNGGANAGHTVVVGEHKFAFHLLPCGLIYPHTQNLLGNGTVIHLPSLFNELAPLGKAGITWEGRLKLSDRATLLFDFHKTVDGLLETRRAGDGGKSIGTTKQGIGPAYASKATRNSVRVGHLKLRSAFQERLRRSIEDHQMMYKFEYDVQAELDKCVGRRGGGRGFLRAKRPAKPSPRTP